MYKGKKPLLITAKPFAFIHIFNTRINYSGKINLKIQDYIMRLKSLVDFNEQKQLTTA